MFHNSSEKNQNFSISHSFFEPETRWKALCAHQGHSSHNVSKTLFSPLDPFMDLFSP